MSKNTPLYLDIGNGLSIMMGFPGIATWNTAGRPTSPKAGTIGFNTQANQLEIWVISSWFVLPLST